MIYEWATGIRIVDMMKTPEQVSGASRTGAATCARSTRSSCTTSASRTSTYICGRKVPKAYRVKPGYYIRRHRPLTLTLWAEYVEGVLYP